MKKAATALVIACIMLFAVACNPDVGGDDTTEATTAAVVRDLNLCDGSWTIVIPYDASSSLKAAVNTLTATIKDITGTEIAVATDAFVKDTGGNEILIGSTLREESKRQAEGLRYLDYTVRAVSPGRIVLLGHSERNDINAVNWFLKNAVREKGSAGSLPVAENFCYLSEYAYGLGSLEVGGRSIGEFSISTEKYSETEYRDAVLLRERISSVSGWILGINEDDEDGGGEIEYVTDGTLAVGGYKISVTDGKMTVAFRDMYGSYAATEYLTGKLFVKNSEGRLDIPSGTELTGSPKTLPTVKNDAEIRIIYNNALGNSDNEIYPASPRGEMLAKLYIAYDADVICLQEASEARHMKLRNVLKNAGYSFVVTGASGGYTPVYYKTERFTLVDSGALAYTLPSAVADPSKSAVWAVLEEKTTGKRFAVVSTHFSVKDSGGITAVSTRKDNAEQLVGLITRILGEYDVPLYAGGDFNCNPSSEAYGILTSAGYVTAQSTATLTEDIKTTHSYPELDKNLGIYKEYSSPNGKTSAAIDHVFCAGNGVAVTRYDVCTDVFALLSTDHCPIITDIILG